MGFRFSYPPTLSLNVQKTFWSPFRQSGSHTGISADIQAARCSKTLTIHLQCQITYTIIKSPTNGLIIKGHCLGTGHTSSALSLVICLWEFWLCKFMMFPDITLILKNLLIHDKSTKFLQGSYKQNIPYAQHTKHTSVCHFGQWKHLQHGLRKPYTTIHVQINQLLILKSNFFQQQIPMWQECSYTYM